MKLSKEAAKIFEREFAKVIEREKAEAEFLPQEDFKTCRDRAANGVLIAMEPVIDFIALAISKHREEAHNDNTLDEQASLLAKMPADDIEMSTQSFWNH